MLPELDAKTLALVQMHLAGPYAIKKDTVSIDETKIKTPTKDKKGIKSKKEKQKRGGAPYSDNSCALN